MPKTSAISLKQQNRITFFDTLRGLTIVSMVLFHATYDLCYLYGFDWTWFSASPVQEIWRRSISWTFLFLAGWMTSFSRNNLKRAGLYGLVALLIYVATTLAAVDTPINFGIMFCMAASTLIYTMLKPLLSRTPPFATLVSLLILFIATLQVPHAVYEVEHLAWLGFPTATFASGDYYPLLPFTFMYLAGASAARIHNMCSASYPSWMLQDFCPPLTWLGQKSLIVYVIHQPLILLVLMLVF